MMAATRQQVLSLYKQMLRESQKFSSYNFRNYTLRKIKCSFRDNKNVNPDVIGKYIEEAKTNLELIKRQVLIGNLYSTDKLVIENQN